MLYYIVFPLVRTYNEWPREVGRHFFCKPILEADQWQRGRELSEGLKQFPNKLAPGGQDPSNRRSLL